MECGAWGTLKKETVDDRAVAKGAVSSTPAEIIDLTKREIKGQKRIKTEINEVDRVLGGGIVPGSLLLLGGEPGIGKSTLMAQIANAISNYKVVYISGEESAEQIKQRLERLKCDFKNINFISETNVEKIIASLEKVKPALSIIDSIQTVYSLLSPSEPGSINQIRTSTVRFLEIAKKYNLTIILTGHITKDGLLAGPKSLEHIVDTVLYLESEKAGHYRILRATKNRFGPVNEVGIFIMTSTGFKQVKNPSAVFVDTSQDSITGSVISCILEGSRPFLVEIQALVTKTVFGYPQRKTSGFDLNRLQVLTAVLTKRANVNLTNQDVILNIVGGLKVTDPGLDLAVCLAIISSLLNQVIKRKTIVLGEVGLGGEVRNVSKLKERLVEAEKLGFKRAMVPEANIKTKEIKLDKIKSLKEIVKSLAQG